MDIPKVSVLTLTYNHEKYIAQALDSALEQITDFPYEIVVSDDCSTDKTRAILADYQSRYPGKIRLLLNEHNIGMHKNMEQVFFSGQGQYLAMMEGDDYWTSADKLQKQVDFLDTHPDCTVCFHNVQSMSEANLWEPANYCPDDMKEISTLPDLFKSNFIPTVSVVYRRGILREIPSWVEKLKIADWPLHILHAQHGDVGYINDLMGVYRIHNQGVWSSLQETQRLQESIRTLETINIYLDYKYDSILRESLAVYNHRLIEVAQQPLQQQFSQLERNSQYERESLQNLSQHLQNELRHSKSLYEQSQAELTQSQVQLSQLRGVLAYSQTQVVQTQADIGHLQEKVQQQENQVQNIRTRLQAKHQKLQEKRQEVQDLRDRIAAIETSKFWKLRRKCLKVKRALGVSQEE